MGKCKWEKTPGLVHMVHSSRAPTERSLPCVHELWFVFIGSCPCSRLKVSGVSSARLKAAWKEFARVYKSDYLLEWGTGGCFIIVTASVRGLLLKSFGRLLSFSFTGTELRDQVPGLLAAFLTERQHQCLDLSYPNVPPTSLLKALP